MITPVRTLKCPNYHAKLFEPRRGIMLHFDDSSSDESAWEWFMDPTCKVSYNDLVLDNGALVRITPTSARAYHAGVCRPSNPKQLPYRDANSAFYGLAAATNNKTKVTTAQLKTIVERCVEIFTEEKWDLQDVWRITGHENEACFPQHLENGQPHPLAGQRGRKIDPTGTGTRAPILSLIQVRQMVAG